MLHKIILNIILNRSIWPIDENLTGTTLSDQIGSVYNGNKGLTLHFSTLSDMEPQQQEAILCHTKDIQLFGERGLIPLQEIKSGYSRPCKQNGKHMRCEFKAYWKFFF